LKLVNFKNKLRKPRKNFATQNKTAQPGLQLNPIYKPFMRTSKRLRSDPLMKAEAKLLLARLKLPETFELFSDPTAIVLTF
jgi:hypothetical protein